MSLFLPDNKAYNIVIGSTCKIFIGWLKGNDWNNLAQLGNENFLQILNRKISVL